MEATKEQKILQTIIQKAWESDVFKQELIENPVNAIENLTGEKMTFPNGKTIVVRDQTDETTVYINIPVEPNLDDMELSDDQLEAVAGGKTTPVIVDSGRLALGHITFEPKKHF